MMGVEKVKVVCRANTGAALTVRFLNIGNSVHSQFGGIEIGRVSTVYGIVSWKGALHYLVIGSPGGYPLWYPADLFSVIDHALPRQWYFRPVGQEQGIDALWGYRELVLSDDHYRDLIELESHAIDIFVRNMAMAEQTDHE